MNPIEASKAAAAIRSAPLFSALDDAAIGDLLSGCDLLRLRRGAQILRPGEPADRFYLIVSGRVKVFKLSARGAEQILHMFGPGETFGEAAMWAGAAFPAFADAVTDVQLIVVPRRTIHRAVSRSAELAMLMLAGLSRKLQEFAHLIEGLALKDVAARLAELLLAESQRAGSATIRLGQTKRAVAARIGAAPETLSRALAKLKKEGLIRLDGAQITLRDQEALARLAERTARPEGEL